MACCVRCVKTVLLDSVRYGQFRRVFVAPPSRRLSGGRLARRRGRDALGTAGKMPALPSNGKGAIAQHLR
jgi:hypothetical protein